MQREKQLALLRQQRHVEYLEDVWRNKNALSPETVRQLLSNLPEPYKNMAIQTLAERLVNEMKIHFLSLVVTFQEKTQLEGMDEEEYTETLHDIEAETLKLMELSKQVCVYSLDDLIRLSNITFGLRVLSDAQDAESAESWMYKLPLSYREKLQQERLVKLALVQRSTFPGNKENTDLL